MPDIVVDPDEVTATPTPAPPTSGPAAPELSPPSQSPEPAMIEVAGEKHVPLGALTSERERRQQAEKRAQDAEARVLAQQPYVEFVAQNQHLWPQPGSREPEPPTDDPEALEAARLLDFYTPKGELDLARGRQHLALVRREAQAIAQQTLQPVQQASLQQHAQQHYGQLLHLKLPDGSPVRQEVVDAVWRQAMSEPNGLQTLADPRSAAALGLMIIATDGLTRGQAPAAPTGLPVVTEPAGGPGPRRGAMTPLEQTIAHKRGVDAQRWTAYTKDHVAGRPQILEDD